MRKKEDEFGDCYEVHGKAIIKHKESLLCHGIVWHPKVGWHGHAWLENGNVCLDISNGNEIYMLKTMYYNAGKIKDVQYYTSKEAAKMMLETGTFGPWKK